MSSSKAIAVALLVAMTTAAAAQQPAPARPQANPKVLASCPPGVSFVNIIEGSYDPPAYANPDVEAKDSRGGLRNEWNRLNQDPSYAPALRAVCSYGGDTTLTAKRKAEVAIPREARVCILDKGSFTCFDKRP